MITCDVQETPEHGTTEHGTPAEHWWNTGGTLVEHRNTGGTPEHRRNNGTLAKQSEYYTIVEYEKNSGITEHQNNTKKYYKYRTTTY